MRPHHLLPLLLLPFAHTYDSKACNNHPELCSLPYANITYLGTHNAPMMRNHATSFSLSGNQYFNTTAQLSAGVRLLQTQLHHHTADAVDAPSDDGQIHVCHSRCSLLDGGSLVAWLSDIATWMAANPSDVVTLLLVNEGNFALDDVADAFDEAEIEDLIYAPPADLPLAQFPTLQELIDRKQRLVVFVTDGERDDDTPPYLLDQWDYIWENPYQHYAENHTLSCELHRPSGLAVDGKGIPRAVEKGMGLLFNAFLYTRTTFYEAPDEGRAGDTNGRLLLKSVENCRNSATWAGLLEKPTYVLVDFFNEGRTIEVLDGLNGLDPKDARNRVDPGKSPKRGEEEGEGLTVSPGGGGGGSERVDFLVDRVDKGGKASWGDWIIAGGDWGKGLDWFN